jgi:hypothetical protein
MGYAQSSDYAQYADFSFTVNNFEGDTYLVDASDHLDASSSYAVDITNSVSETSPLEPNSVGEAYLASDSYSVQEESFMHQADASDLADSGFDSDAAEGSLDAMGEGYDGQFADTDFNALEAPDSFCVDDIDAFGLFDLF